MPASVIAPRGGQDKRRVAPSPSAQKPQRTLRDRRGVRLSRAGPAGRPDRAGPCGSLAGLPNPTRRGPRPKAAKGRFMAKKTVCRGIQGEKRLEMNPNRLRFEMTTSQSTFNVTPPRYSPEHTESWLRLPPFSVAIAAKERRPIHLTSQGASLCTRWLTRCVHHSPSTI